jgi:hypothetical protein
VPILAPIGKEDDDETSFKAICMEDYETKLVTFVFSSLTGEWCVAASLAGPHSARVAPMLFFLPWLFLQFGYNDI